MASVNLATVMREVWRSDHPSSERYYYIRSARRSAATKFNEQCWPAEK